MRKRSFTLLDGVRVGEQVLRDVTVREATLGDTLDAAGKGLGGAALQLAVDMARIERLGDLANPGPGVLKLMSQNDWLLVESKLLEIDAEGLAALKEAGLLNGAGGREEPGVAPPGGE